MRYNSAALAFSKTRMQMKKHRPAASALVVFLLLFCGSVTAQETESKKKKVLRITGKAAVFLAKTTAKAAFETAKFTGKYIVSPAFKNVAVPLAKAAPSVAKTTVKLAARGGQERHRRRNG